MEVPFHSSLMSISLAAVSGPTLPAARTETGPTQRGWPGRCVVNWRSAVPDPIVAAVPNVAHRVAAVPNVAHRVVAAVPNVAHRVIPAVPNVADRVVAAPNLRDGFDGDRPNLRDSLVATVPYVADRVIGTVPGGSARGACTQGQGHRHAHNYCLHPVALVLRHGLAFPLRKVRPALCGNQTVAAALGGCRSDVGSTTKERPARRPGEPPGPVEILGRRTGEACCPASDLGL
jgi:hypothetical protein